MTDSLPNKNSTQPLTEESAQAEVPYHLMNDRIPTVHHPFKVDADEIDHPAVIHPLRVGRRIERKLRGFPDDGHGWGSVHALRYLAVKALRLSR